MLPRKSPKIASAAAAAAAVEGRDHISNLQDGALQHILSFLPAQDAVRTCVLARRWRHLWKSTTCLRFVCGGTKAEIEFVEQRLRLRIREDRPLDRCEFRIWLDDKNELFNFDMMSRIVLWIRIALHCKLRVLQLKCLGDNYQDIRPQDGHPFFISQHLKKLELEGLFGFPNRLLDLSCCPNLEDLEIGHSNLGDLLLISSESLKRLTIRSCYFDDELRLPICAPNLVSLWLEVCHGRSPSLQRMPSLLTAFIKIHHGYHTLSLDSDDYRNQSVREAHSSTIFKGT